MSIPMSKSTCDHGRRPVECKICLREWSEHEEWQRAVDQAAETARLLGYERPDEHTAYLDVLSLVRHGEAE